MIPTVFQRFLLVILMMLGCQKSPTWAPKVIKYHSKAWSKNVMKKHVFVWSMLTPTWTPESKLTASFWLSKSVSGASLDPTGSQERPGAQCLRMFDELCMNFRDFNNDSDRFSEISSCEFDDVLYGLFDLCLHGQGPSPSILMNVAWFWFNWGHFWDVF